MSGGSRNRSKEKGGKRKELQLLQARHPSKVITPTQRVVALSRQSLTESQRPPGLSSTSEDSIPMTPFGLLPLADVCLHSTLFVASMIQLMTSS